MPDKHLEVKIIFSLVIIMITSFNSIHSLGFRCAWKLLIRLFFTRLINVLYFTLSFKTGATAPRNQVAVVFSGATEMLSKSKPDARDHQPLTMQGRRAPERAGYPYRHQRAAVYRCQTCEQPSSHWSPSKIHQQSPLVSSFRRVPEAEPLLPILHCSICVPLVMESRCLFSRLKIYLSAI